MSQLSLSASSTWSLRSGWPVSSRFWTLGLAAVLVLGVAFRVIWVSDIEYKSDEEWTFEQVQKVRQGERLPLLGMPTSQGFRNPGLTLWVFLPLAEIANVHDPRDLARAVQVLNVVALIGLTFFALRVVPRQEREIWLWAVALVAVNPLAVLFQRKIWPPSVYPLITVLFLLSWWYRERRWGAVCWGLIGACLGQIQGAGFFFAAGFVLWAFLFDRKRVAWGSWFIGSCVGVLPMLPWIHYMLTAAPYKPHNPRAWVHALEGKFWSRWALEPFGFGLDYSLFKDFPDFLRFPYIAGMPTYLGLVLHVLVGMIGAAIAYRALCRLRRNGFSPGKLFVGRSSPTAFAQNASLWGYGLLFTLSLLPLHRQYMIVLFPLQFVWLTRLALGTPGLGKPGPDAVGELEVHRGRALLALLVVCQALITLQFLTYVHRQPIIHGDYGVPYRVQDHTQRHALAGG